MRRFLTFLTGPADPALHTPPATSEPDDTDEEANAVSLDAEPVSNDEAALEARLYEDDEARAAALAEQAALPSPTGSPQSPITALPPPTPPVQTPAERLHDVATVLRAFASGATVQPRVIPVLKDLAETMVWADQHDPNVWDTFLEFSVMPLLVRCLRATQAPPVAAAGEDAGGVRLGGGDAKVEGVVEAVGKVVAGPGRGALGEEVPEVGEFDREFEYVGATRMPGKARDAHADWESRQSAEGVGEGETDGEDVLKVASTVGNGVVEYATVDSEADAPTDMGSTTSALAGGEAEQDALSDSEEQKAEQVIQDAPADIQARILQTLSIVIQSVSRQQSLLCLFSSNHINDILSFEFAFEHEEMLATFMSVIKSIALRLDEGLLQLFFDPIHGSFPLYTAVTRFFDHPESMVRIAVRNVTLTIYALGDSEVLRFAAKDEMLYFQKTAELLAKLCGSVARAFELLLDDGREIRRTRSRTGLFRRRVKISELTAKLEEVDNLCAYLGDVSTVSQSYLHPLVVNLMSSRLFSPFFRPLASQASPESMQLLHKRWPLSRSNPAAETKPALPLFDAAARCLVLACVLTHCKSSPLGSILVRDLCRPTSEFEHRHVLHGLKAMATDISGTERVTFVSLCAIEAFINCEAASKQLLGTLKYDFYLDDVDDIGESAANGVNKICINIGMPDEDDLERRSVEPLLMTLSDFEAPLTPTTSRPSTPTLPTMASMASLDGLKTPPNGWHMDSRMSSFDSGLGLNLSPPASSPPPVVRSDSDGILSSFQFGESSLREAISSIVLVVRRREIRTLRVMHRISGILSAVEKRTSDINSSVDVSKIILDELAGVIRSFLKNKRTTIVSIEQMFDNFRSCAESSDMFLEGSVDLDTLVSADRLPAIASEFPKGTGKRRRVHTEDAAPPTEIEDAHTFFVMARVYDESLRAAKALDRFGSVSKQVIEALTESGVDDSYLDKRDALEDVSEAVLKHGEVD